jgi:hypothetical protein
MKNSLLIILLSFFLTGQLLAQKSVILFTEGGEPFYLYLNEILQQKEAVKSIKLTDVALPSYKVRVVFTDESKGVLTKNLYVGEDPLTVYKIALNKKGAYGLRYVGSSMAPMNDMAIHKIDVTDGAGVKYVPRNVETVAKPVEVEIVERCTPTTAADFEVAAASIKSKSFSDSKMTLAKKASKENCLTAVQIKTILDIFDFESSKIEYAKYAYDYCFDPNNYYKVNDTFEFESSIEKLDAYITSR